MTFFAIGYEPENARSKRKRRQRLINQIIYILNF